jgi:hypothetical protein
MLSSSYITCINMAITTIIVWQVHILASADLTSYRERSSISSKWNAIVQSNDVAIPKPDYDTTSSNYLPSSLATHLNWRLEPPNLLGSSDNRWINITVHSNLINFGISNIGELTISCRSQQPHYKRRGWKLISIFGGRLQGWIHRTLPWISTSATGRWLG